jgi:hypothetical protein
MARPAVGYEAVHYLGASNAVGEEGEELEVVMFARLGKGRFASGVKGPRPYFSSFFFRSSIGWRVVIL